MREVDCPCGITLTGADDQDLNRLAHEHVDQDHIGEGISDEFISNHIAQNARDAVAS
jgi:hypothetical protein